MRVAILLSSLAVMCVACGAGETTSSTTQNVCTSTSGGSNSAQICVQSNNCFNMPTNSSCQITVTYNSSYGATSLGNPQSIIKSPFSMASSQCPVPSSTQSTCIFTVNYTSGGGTESAPFTLNSTNFPVNTNGVLTSSINISGQ